MLLRYYTMIGGAHLCPMDVHVHDIKIVCSCTKTTKQMSYYNNILRYKSIIKRDIYVLYDICSIYRILHTGHPP